MKKVTFKKRLDAEIRAFSPEDIKKSETFKTSKHVNLPWQGAYNEVTRDWYLDKFTALMYLKCKYNNIKKNRRTGDDKQWFEAAIKDFFDVNEESYYENKNKKDGILSDFNKDEAVTRAEMIIFVNNYLKKIKDECGDTEYGRKFQSFSEKEGRELSQLKIIYKNWLRDVGSKPPGELTGLNPEAKKMANYVGAAIVVVIVIWLFSITIHSDGSSSSSGSTYQSPKDICEPTFRSCVANNPEILWGDCKSVYFSCLSN